MEKKWSDSPWHKQWCLWLAIGGIFTFFVSMTLSTFIIVLMRVNDAQAIAYRERLETAEKAYADLRVMYEQCQQRSRAADDAEMVTAEEPSVNVDDGGGGAPGNCHVPPAFDSPDMLIACQVHNVPMRECQRFLRHSWQTSNGDIHPSFNPPPGCHD